MAVHSLTVKQILSRVRQVFPNAPEAYVISLINDALTIGGNLDSLNRSILDKGGKLLAQIPILGEDMKAGLYSAFDEDPDAIQKFITNSRIFVAQNIATITGEGSSRVSEPERFLANQALATLDTMFYCSDSSIYSSNLCTTAQTTCSCRC